MSIEINPLIYKNNLPHITESGVGKEQRILNLEGEVGRFCKERVSINNKPNVKGYAS